MFYKASQYDSLKFKSSYVVLHIVNFPLKDMAI